MFFEEETKDTHGNMDDYDLDIEQGESVSWDKLLDDKEDLDEPADLETVDDSADDDIAEKLLNMDDDSFDAFVVKQQNAQVAENPSGSSDEVNFDELLLDDLDDETEDALKKAVKNDLSSDNNYEPEVLQEDEVFEDDEDDFNFVEENEENVEQVTAVEPENSQNIQEEIAQINDLDEEDESVAEFLGAYDDKDEPESNRVDVIENDNQSQSQFAESTPDVPVIAKNTQENTDYNNPQPQNSGKGNSAKKAKSNEPKKQNSSLTTILLLIVLLGAGGYYAYTNYGDKLNFAGSADTSMDVSQDNSLMGAEGADTGDLPIPDGDAGEIPAPPADEDGAVAPADIQPSADTQATKSVSKAIEQGRTKISKDKDTNKANIQIVTTGRVNPFVPVGNLNNIGFITSPKIDILPPNETLGQPDPLLDKLMSIKVSGILYDGVNSSAVINLNGVDYFVQKGDKIDSFTVINITKTSVAIKEKNNIFSASIGQTFSGGDTIEGQTQIHRYNNNIIRQYTTASDINVNSTGEQSN